MMRTINRLTFGVVLVLVGGQGLLAQDDTAPAWSFSGTLGSQFDLRDRGVSLTGRDIAPTLNVLADHKSGFYTGAFVAANLNTPLGQDMEIEPFVGYATAVGGYTLDFSAEVDVFLGGEEDAFVEFRSAISRDFGLAFTRFSVAYAPDGRWSAPGVDSVYVRTDLEVPVPGMPQATLIARYGYDILDGLENRSDWSVGASYFLGDLELSVAYEDSEAPGPFGASRVVAGVRLFF